MTIFTGANAPAVGLTETNALSDALRSLGMRVIVGDDLSQSARLIKEAIAQGVKFPIISLEDKTGIGKKSFLSRYAKTGHRVVIVSSDPGSIIDSPESTYVATPARLGDILLAAGFSVDADDPRLAPVMDSSYSIESAGSPAPPAREPEPFDGLPDPSPRRAPRRETLPAPSSGDDDIDDLFAGVPEAKVDATGEPVVQGYSPEPTIENEPRIPEESAPPAFGDSEPDWMSPAPAPASAPAPAPAAPTPVDEEPEWMIPSTPPVVAEEEVPEWAQPVPARSHQNQADSEWLDSVVPDEDEVATPVFDDAPLDPNWEPEEEQPAVDLNEPASFIPAPTSPIIARPRAQQVEPSWAAEVPEPPRVASTNPPWMDNVMGDIPAPAPAPEPEVQPVVVDDFEIIAPVIARDPSAPPMPVEAPQKSFDEMLNEMMDSSAPAPVPAPAPTPAVPAFSPNDPSMWSTAPAPAPVPEPRPEKLCPVVVSMASKGGVGKTTIALALAERASKAGLRVTLIDGNRGQGGIRKFLRVNERIVSIYDAAIRKDPKLAFAYPKEIASARDPKLPNIGFAVVLAPPDSLADPRLVTAQMYAEVMRYARSTSDLVIMDTQISERFDTTGIIESVAIPSICSPGGFGLGITDDSSEGIRNLDERLDHFSSIGVGREHLLSIVNKMDYFDDSIVSAKRNQYDDRSVFVGIVGSDEDFKNKHNVGIIDVESSSLAPALTSILRTVTKDARFNPPPAAEPPRRGGLFGRRK